MADQITPQKPLPCARHCLPIYYLLSVYAQLNPAPGAGEHQVPGIGDNARALHGADAAVDMPTSVTRATHARAGNQTICLQPAAHDRLRLSSDFVTILQAFALFTERAINSRIAAKP
jgi:hypothetical protein